MPLTMGLTFILMLLLSSCEKNVDGVIDPLPSAPFMRSATITENFFHLDTSTSALLTRLPNGRFSISESVTATVNIGSSHVSIESVRLRLYKPGSGTSFFSVRLSPLNQTASSIVYGGNFTFTLDRTDIGVFHAEVYAEDVLGTPSNSLRLPIRIARNNSYPVIVSVTGPDTIVRPATGFSLVFLTATASDSDGYADLQEVAFRRIFPSTTSDILLYDDGLTQLSGDEIEGDAVFSRLVRIDSSAITGEQIFEFFARDKSGEISPSVLDTIIVLP